MPIDEFIINIYLMVEQYYKIVVTKPLRVRLTAAKAK